MPFGLDFKTMVITILFMWFAFPFIMGKISSMRGRGSE